VPDSDKESAGDSSRTFSALASAVPHTRVPESVYGPGGAKRGSGGKLQPLPADLEAGVGLLPGSGDDDIGVQGTGGGVRRREQEGQIFQRGNARFGLEGEGAGLTMPSAAKSSGTVPSPFTARPPAPEISNAPMLSRPGS